MQQRGLEAFDAFHNWLKIQEKRGNFEILDEKQREAFYQYWDTESGFLIDDKQQIESIFLNPEWKQ